MRALDAADPDATKRMGAVFGNAMTKAGNVFRSVDRDGDGIPDEPQAMAVMKGAFSALAGGVERAKTLASKGSATPEGEGETQGVEDPQPDASQDDNASVSDSNTSPALLSPPAHVDRLRRPVGW